jgi:hypothetical protein
MSDSSSPAMRRIITAINTERGHHGKALRLCVEFTDRKKPGEIGFFAVELRIGETADCFVARLEWLATALNADDIEEFMKKHPH